MPWPPRITPIASGCSRRIAAMSSPSWNPGRRHGTHATRSPKHCRVSASPSAAVANAIPASGMEVVDMGRVDQPVHRGVDRRRGTAASEQAVVERRDHLVLALDAGVDVDERSQPIEPEDRQAGLGQRAEIAARALDPQQLDRAPGHRIDGAALGRRVAAGVVRVLRVGPESMRTLEQIGDGVARRSGRRRDVRRHGVGASARARRRRARAAADGRIRTGLTWRLPASAPDRRESHLGAIGERGIGAGRR